MILLDRSILLPLALIVIVFASLGFVQIVFQADMKRTLNQSEANFDKMTQTQAIMNQTLSLLSNTSPQSNFSAQAEAVQDIQYIKDTINEIKLMLLSSSNNDNST